MLWLCHGFWPFLELPTCTTRSGLVMSAMTCPTPRPPTGCQSDTGDPMQKGSAEHSACHGRVKGPVLKAQSSKEEDTTV